MKHTSQLLLALCVIALAAEAHSSGCPNLINYQGRVTDAGGAPVADGTYGFDFRFFTVPAGGSDLWSESDSLTVTDGLFNHLLGSVNPLPPGLFPDNDVLYLEVIVNGETMVPRTLMVSVGYARRVNTINGSDGGAIHIDGAGPDDVVAIAQGDPNASIELRSGTFGGNPYIDFSNDILADYDARIQLGDDGQLDIYVDSALVLPTGKVGIGTATPGSEAGLTGTRMEIADANGLNSDLTLRVSGGGATGSAAQNFAKSRGTLSSPTIVQNGDWLGHILFVGYDGTDFASPAAWIRGSVDGTPGADDMPGRLEFLTTPDGSSSPVTQMTIGNAGNVGIGTLPSTDSKLDVFHLSTASSPTIAVSGLARNSSTGQAAGGVFTAVDDGTGVHIGVRGNASSSNVNTSYGVYGEADNGSSGEAIAGFFNAPSAGTGRHYGVYASSFGGSGFPVYGGYFFTDTTGTGTKYGLYATADTAEGYAGYFEGDVTANGKVGIGTGSPQGALDVTSTTGAFIVPRMTTAQRNALTTVNGMIIYNTSDNQFNFYENGAWVTK